MNQDRTTCRAGEILKEPAARKAREETRAKIPDQNSERLRQLFCSGAGMHDDQDERRICNDAETDQRCYQICDIRRCVVGVTGHGSSDTYRLLDAFSGMRELNYIHFAGTINDPQGGVIIRSGTFSGKKHV